jgi:regulator of PEP synthase PpsR (kinase-PPPase family)
MIALKETETIAYIDYEKIAKEVEEAKKLFKKYNWPIVDVTRKAVEETAASIIKIYEIAKENG